MKTYYAMFKVYRFLMGIGRHQVVYTSVSWPPSILREPKISLYLHEPANTAGCKVTELTGGELWSRIRMYKSMGGRLFYRSTEYLVDHVDNPHSIRLWKRPQKEYDRLWFQ